MDEGGHCDDDAVDGGDEKDEEDGNVDVTGKGVKLMLKPTRKLWPTSPLMNIVIITTKSPWNRG